MSKKELLELLKKSLQDALDSIQGRDKQELNEEKRTELKKEIETHPAMTALSKCAFGQGFTHQQKLVYVYH